MDHGFKLYKIVTIIKKRSNNAIFYAELNKGIIAGPFGPSWEGPGIGHKMASDTKRGKKKKKEEEKGKRGRGKKGKREKEKKR